MINICLVSDSSNGAQLAFKLLDLDYPEKEYQAFELGVKGQDYTDIPVMGTDLLESGVVIIDNLIPESVYEIVGRVKYNNIWTDISQCAFITQANRHKTRGNPKPCIRFKGGAL